MQLGDFLESARRGAQNSNLVRAQAIIRKRSYGNNERVWRAARKISLSLYAWNAEQRTGLINATAPFLLLFSPPSIRFSPRRSGAFANRSVVRGAGCDSRQKNYYHLPARDGFTF